MKITLIILSAIAFFAQPNSASAKKLVGQSNHTVTINHYDDGSMDVAGGSHDAKGTSYDDKATLFLGNILGGASKVALGGSFGAGEGGGKTPSIALSGGSLGGGSLGGGGLGGGK